METIQQPEELLREAACYGDIESIQKLIMAGANVNSQHNINGWTPLHWACKRNQFESVKLLLSHGADQTLKNIENKTAKDVTTSSELLNVMFPLESNDIPFLEAAPLESSPFKSSYLAHPPGDYKLNFNTIKTTQTENYSQDSSTSPMRKLNSHQSSSVDMSNGKNCAKDILLRLRIAETGDPDFIEVELAVGKLTYGSFLAACAQELNMNPQLVERVRKLPNIRLRNDMDIKRLKNCDYLEFVVKGKSKSATSTSMNPYKSISNFQNQPILY